MIPASVVNLTVHGIGSPPRALDPGELCGDASKARRLLKWKPRTDFKALVRMMVDDDLRTSAREAALAQA